jgi:ureidoglycolate hydrolase
MTEIDKTGPAAEVLELSARVLTAAEFAPYGEVLEARGSLRPQLENGVLSIERVHLGANPRVEELAMHFSYDQVFVAAEGQLALVVAPAPDRSGVADNDPRGADAFDVDYAMLRAFVLEPGDAVMVRRGSWHTTAPLTDAVFVNVTRRDGDEVTANSGRYRPYIENVNIARRDGRMLLVTPTGR